MVFANNVLANHSLGLMISPELHLDRNPAIKLGGIDASHRFNVQNNSDAEMNGEELTLGSPRG